MMGPEDEPPPARLDFTAVAASPPLAPPAESSAAVALERETLEKGRVGVSEIADSPPRAADVETRTAVELERKVLENEQLLEELEDRRQDRAERLKYADRVFGLIVAWLAWMGLVILWQGFQYNFFKLSDPVLITIVGSTTATVIGIFLIVTRYLFPNNKR